MSAKAKIVSILSAIKNNVHWYIIVGIIAITVVVLSMALSARTVDIETISPNKITAGEVVTLTVTTSEKLDLSGRDEFVMPKRIILIDVEDRATEEDFTYLLKVQTHLSASGTYPITLRTSEKYKIITVISGVTK